LGLFDPYADFQRVHDGDMTTFLTPLSIRINWVLVSLIPFNDTINTVSSLNLCSIVSLFIAYSWIGFSALSVWLYCLSVVLVFKIFYYCSGMSRKISIGRTTWYDSTDLLVSRLPFLLIRRKVKANTTHPNRLSSRHCHPQ
jgi:hypothetical protein